MAKDLGASIEAAVLFDLMDRMTETMGINVLGMKATRTCLEWALDNGLLTAPVEYSGAPVSPRDFVFGCDFGVDMVADRNDPAARAMARTILGIHKDDRADDAGTVLEPPAPSGECHDAPDEGPQAPASAAAESAGGGPDLPPAPEDTSPGGSPSALGDEGEDAPPKAAEASAPASAATLVTGSLSEQEKAEARRLHAEGLNGYQIADRLNRRPQPILMMLAPRGGRPKKTEMLGGDRGGLQRHSPAEHDPVQAEAATAEVLPPASAQDHAPETPADALIWWQPIIETLKAAHKAGQKAGWTIARDLILAEGVQRGDDWMVIADQLGADVRTLRQRWIALTPGGQKPWQVKQLIEVLRDRAGAV